MHMIDPQPLIDRLWVLEDEASRLKAEAQQIKDKLAAMATFKPGSATGHVQTPTHKVTVTRRETVKYDQAKLDEARQAIGDKAFLSAFKWEFKPIDKRTLDHWLAVAADEHKAFVLRAMTTKPAAPSVKVKEL